MEFTYIADGIDAVVVDNFYTDEEYESVLNEQLLLLPQLQPPEKTAGALSLDGETIIKKNKGIFIDNNSSSKIISINYNKLNSTEFKNHLIKLNSLYKIYADLNHASTLLSYYVDKEYYDVHVDITIFTVVVYAHKQPTKFSGGDLTLYSCNDKKYVTIESRNNRAIIFPSCTPHKVSPVVLDGDDGYGRFCISHFIEKKDPRL